MTKHVTLFGRKMIKGRGFDYYHLPGVTLGKELDSRGDVAWYGSTGDINVNGFATPPAAARALERKIVAAHRRLGKLVAGTKGAGHGSKH